MAVAWYLNVVLIFHCGTQHDIQKNCKLVPHPWTSIQSILLYIWSVMNGNSNGLKYSVKRWAFQGVNPAVLVALPSNCPPVITWDPEAITVSSTLRFNPSPQRKLPMSSTEPQASSMTLGAPWWHYCCHTHYLLYTNSPAANRATRKPHQTITSSILCLYTTINFCEDWNI